MKIRTWANKDSWDEIIERLEYFESFVLPYKQWNVTKDNNDLKKYESTKNIQFSYSIENFYPHIILNFSDSVYLHQANKSIGIAEVSSTFQGVRNERNVFLNKKDAMVFLLNLWEIYMKTKQYKKDYQKFLKQIKNYANL